MILIDEAQYPLIYSNPSSDLYVYDIGDAFFIREGNSRFYISKTSFTEPTHRAHTFSIYTTVDGDIILHDLIARKQIILGHAIIPPSEIYSGRTPSEYMPHIETESSTSGKVSRYPYYPAAMEEIYFEPSLHTPYAINK